MLRYLTPTLLVFSLILTSCSKTEEGIASWYSVETNAGTETASGEELDPAEFTAAHRTLAFGTIVEVTNLKNEKTVEVRINDRGPFVEGRIIDLSEAAAKALEMVDDGLVPVSVRVVREPKPK